MSEMPGRLRTRFRIYYLWVAIGGIVLLVSPEIVTAVIEQKFDSAVIGDWITRIGTAAMIGAALAFMLDQWQTKSITELTDGKINKIIENVFDGVFKSAVDADIYDLFRQSVLNCPIYRDPFKLILKLTRDTRTINGRETEVLRCEWHEEYLLWSLQLPKALHDLEVAIVTNEIPDLEDLCGITEIRIGDKTRRGDPFLGERSADNFMVFRERVEVPHGNPVKVESYSVCYKTLTDSETFESVIPSKHIEVEVHVSGCRLSVQPHIMVEGGWREGGRHQRDATCHWIANSAMLPHQGIALSWSPEKQTVAPPS